MGSRVVKTVWTTVNNNFKNDNGTTFLSMAYEEFLYVVLFAAKKKYYGIAFLKSFYST